MQFYLGVINRDIQEGVVNQLPADVGLATHSQMIRRPVVFKAFLASQRRKMLDSGAFEAWSTGERPPSFELTVFRARQTRCDFAILLDVIGDYMATRKNAALYRPYLKYIPILVPLQSIPTLDEAKIKEDIEYYTSLGYNMFGVPVPATARRLGNSYLAVEYGVVTVRKYWDGYLHLLGVKPIRQMPLLHKYNVSSLDTSSRSFRHLEGWKWSWGEFNRFYEEFKKPAAWL